MMLMSHRQPHGTYPCSAAEFHCNMLADRWRSCTLQLVNIDWCCVLLSRLVNPINMGRPPGSKDSEPRERRKKSEKEKKATAATKKNRQEVPKAWLQQLFGSSPLSAVGNSGCAAGGANGGSSSKSRPSPTSFTSLPSVVTWLPVKQVHILEQRLLTHVRPPDVQAKLNDDDQLGDLADDKCRHHAHLCCALCSLDTCPTVGTFFGCANRSWRSNTTFANSKTSSSSNATTLAAVFFPSCVDLHASCCGGCFHRWGSCHNCSTYCAISTEDWRARRRHKKESTKYMLTV